MKSIAKWLLDSDEPYFAEVKYIQEAYEAKEKVEIIEESPFNLSLFSGRKRIEYKPVTKYQDVINSIRQTAPVSCCALVINFFPKEEVLPGFKAFVVYVFSKSKLTLFCKHEMEREISWNKRLILNNNQWKVVHCKLKQIDEISTTINNVLESVKESVVQDFSSALNLAKIL
ncbi:MAG: hypothetical protein ACRC2S_10015 [Waterburya sp.]